MKNALLTGINLFIFFCCFGQSAKDDYLPEIKYDTIIFKDPTNITSTKTKFSNVIVIDGRFDSSSLGFYQTNGRKNYSIVSGPGVPRQISNFLEKYLMTTTDNNINIVLVLKKLWLSNECAEEAIDDVNKKTPTGIWLTGIITKFEIYCSYQDGYTPLYRFDSVFSGVSNIKDYYWEYIQDALIASVQKLIEADLNNLSPSRKKMSLQDITAYNNQRFNLPIVSAMVYNKGVYKTFDEFKANSPSIINYEIRKDRLTETIYIKNEVADYPIRDVWGYCDGTNLYIKSANNYFPLFKKQNTFLSYGAKDLARSRNRKMSNALLGGAIGGALGTANTEVSYALKRKVYELDMETGNIF